MNRNFPTFTTELLGAVMTLEYGTALPDAVRSGIGYPVFGSNGMVGHHSQFLVPGPGIVVGRKGSVGAVCWTEESFWPIDTAYYVIPKQDTNLRWLYWLLSSSDLKWLDTSTGVPGLNRNSACNLRIPLPEPTEQSRIAAVLDTVDAAIAQTEAIIAKLKQVRAGLLHDLLTRGLDEHGQLRPPPAEAPHLYQDSPLGKMPKEWRIMAIEHATEKVQDGTHFSPKSTSGPRRYLTSKNVRFGFLDLSDCGWISEEEHREIFRRCDVRWNDILLTKDGANTGNAALNNLSEEFSLLSSVALIRCRPDYSDCYFLLNYLLSPIGQGRLKDLMSGNAITRLTLQKIKAFLCPIPSFDEQQRIAIYLEQCSDAIQSCEREQTKLDRLKSALMSDLLTGRVRVPEGVEVQP